VNSAGTANQARRARQATTSREPAATARNISIVKKNECWSVNGVPVGG
jgi:hypothetical protein